MTNAFDAMWALLEILPAIFLILYLVMGLLFGRKYLAGIPPTGQMQHLDQVQNTMFTLAGLSITAIALFTALYPNLNRIVMTLTYLSWAFVGFVLAGYLINFRQRRLYAYAGEIIEWTALLSVGIAFLVFFKGQMPSAPNLLLVYLTYVLSFVVVASLNLAFYLKFWGSLRAKKR